VLPGDDTFTLVRIPGSLTMRQRPSSTVVSAPGSTDSAPTFP